MHMFLKTSRKRTFVELLESIMTLFTSYPSISIEMTNTSSCGIGDMLHLGFGESNDIFIFDSQVLPYYGGTRNMIGVDFPSVAGLSYGGKPSVIKFKVPFFILGTSCPLSLSGDTRLAYN